MRYFYFEFYRPILNTTTSLKRGDKTASHLNSRIECDSHAFIALTELTTNNEDFHPAYTNSMITTTYICFIIL